MSVPDQSVYTNDNIGCIINASPGSNSQCHYTTKTFKTKFFGLFNTSASP